jgi:Asp-tRNA(Asn)/Glu-tRNA(Gln) amidotransferase A subunit family amidase
MVPLALGTQTGGRRSGRRPFCGVHGMKPTWGRIPWDGAKGYSPALDTVGLYGRSAADLRLMLQAYALAGGDDPPAPGLGQLRLGVVRTPHWAEAEPQAQAAFERTLALLRQRGVPGRAGLAHGCDDINRWQDEVMQDGGRYAFVAGTTEPSRTAARRVQGQAQQPPRADAAAHAFDALDGIAAAAMAFERSMFGCTMGAGPQRARRGPAGLAYPGHGHLQPDVDCLQVPCISLPALWTAMPGCPWGCSSSAARYDDAACCWWPGARCAVLVDPFGRIHHGTDRPGPAEPDAATRLQDARMRFR